MMKITYRTPNGADYFEKEAVRIQFLHGGSGTFLVIHAPDGIDYDIPVDRVYDIVDMAAKQTRVRTPPEEVEEPGFYTVWSKGKDPGSSWLIERTYGVKMYADQAAEGIKNQGRLVKVLPKGQTPEAVK
jgi:hypothetical protein